MQNEEHVIPDTQRKPWNKGKLIGAKPPLRPKHVWSIRTKLQIGGRARDLAMFNLAIDSKLRGCDVVALKVEDVATVVAMDHDGKMRTLREGTGQWTCMPGHADPANPDPMWAIKTRWNGRRPG